MRLVIFDVDGTLVDSFARIRWAMATAFAACDLPIPDGEAIRGIIGLSLPVAISRLAPSVGETGLRALVEAYSESFRSRSAACPDTSFFPGALQALTRLNAQDDVLLAIATGKSRRGMSRILSTYKLAPLFQSVQVADDHPSKPHPSMVERCLRDTGVASDQAVMVGDTCFDLEMGRAAGVGTIGVSWGYHETHMLAPFADHLISDFDALDTALLQLWGARA
ncbi:MAG: HAD-IA family hydrolase [Pseudomonadota bacterium]